VPAFSYIRGTQDAGGYLDTRLESFAAARWLAGFGIDGSQIVALDDVRDYYMPAGTVWGNPYYQQALALDWSAPPKRRYEPLLQRGKIYLVVNANAAYLQRTPTGIDWAVFAADQKRGMHELFSDSEVSVFDISEVH
jgi:hypothetical protein